MKKITLLFSMLFVMAIASNLKAQDYNSAIGLRLGYPFGVTYKTFLNETGALDLFAGTRYSGFTIGAMYQVHSPISDVAGLQWYWGGGVLASFYSYYSGANDTSIGINGVVGLDYTFADAPFNLSLDIMPAFLFGGFYDGFEIWGGLSARYVIK
jgi:hypothetical protein